MTTTLDNLARLHLGGFSAFHVCGAAGVAASVSLSAVLARHAALPLAMLAVLLVAAAAVFFGVAIITKIVTGGERLTYYHYEIAVLAATAVIAQAWGQPVLRWLDIAALAVGAFLGFGRIGCFLVGCCHGRPHRWGVCYGPEHAGEGFPRFLTGVRLLPVQLFESGAVLAIVAAGMMFALSGARPGEALAWYTVAYSAVRFTLEQFRGDPDRPAWGGLSEAQWTSLALTMFAAAALPFSYWRAGASALLGAAALYLAATDGSRRRLLAARHVCEIAELLQSARSLPAGPGDVAMTATPMGLRISSSRFLQGGREFNLYAFSAPEGLLSDKAAGRLCRLIACLARAGGAAEVHKGSHGVYHVIVPEEECAHAF